MNKPRGLRVIFKGKTLQEFAHRYLTDLSASGMFVRTREPLPVGTNLRFDFRLEDSSPLISGTAIVLWMAEESPELNLPSGMELRFESFDPDSEERFQWLQMERRGVTVGREIPLQISSTLPDTLDGQPTDEYDLRQDSWDKVPAPGEVLKSRAADKKIEELIEEEMVQAPAAGGDHHRAEVPEQDDEDHGVEVDLADDEERDSAGAPAEVEEHFSVEFPAEEEDLSEGEGEVPERSDVLVGEGGLPLSPMETSLVYGQRSKWPYIALLLAAAVVGGGGYLLIKQQKEPDTANDPSAEKPRVVRITTVPSGAAVIVDGKPAGTSPVTLAFKGLVKGHVQHTNFLPQQFEVRREDPGWEDRGDRWVLERNLKLHSDAAAKTAVASPITEQDQGSSASDQGAVAKAPIDAGPDQRATQVVRTEPERKGPQKRDRSSRSRVSRRGQEADAGVSRGVDPSPVSAPDAAAPPSPTPAPPPEGSGGTGSPGEPQKDPAGKDEPGAPVEAPPAKKDKPPPPDTSIKMPSWVDKRKRDPKLKKPAWMEKDSPPEGKK